MIINSETLQSYSSHYRQKLIVLYLLYAAYPASKPLSSSSSSQLSNNINPTPNHLTTTPVSVQDATYHESVSDGKRRDEGTAGGVISSTIFFPITPPYSRSGKRSRLTKTHDSINRRMVVKGSTTFDSRMNDVTIPTIPISAAPSLPSLEPDGPCKIDERGRTICPGQNPVTNPILKRSSEIGEATSEFGGFLINSLTSCFTSLISTRIHPSTSPFTLVVILFHILCGIQLAALLLEDGIAKQGLLTRGPTAFSNNAKLGWWKKINRMKFRFKAMLSRFGSHLIGLVTLISIVGLIWHEVLGDFDSSGIPFGRLFIASESVESSGKWVRFGGFSPVRSLIVLETFSAMLFLLQPIKHLLPTSILPPSSPARLSNFLASTIILQPASSRILTTPPPHPPVELDSLWLSTSLIDLLVTSISFVQLFIISLLLPRYSVSYLSMYIIFFGMKNRMSKMRDIHKSIIRTIDCLRIVFKVFPLESSSTSPSTVEEDLDWMCTICFEGARDELEENDEEGNRSEIGNKRRCRLRSCGHIYHAACLVHWLHQQSFCPICHTAVTMPAS